MSCNSLPAQGLFRLLLEINPGPHFDGIASNPPSRSVEGMEVQFMPDVDKKLNELATQGGRAPRMVYESPFALAVVLTRRATLHAVAPSAGEVAAHSLPVLLTSDFNLQTPTSIYPRSFVE
jgi:hypothetical protein